jgi:hypothetical protein
MFANFLQLYSCFLLALKWIHNLGRKPKISHNGDILVICILCFIRSE